MKVALRIGDILIAHGYLTESQLNEALALQKQDKTKRLGELLISQNYISEDHLLEALSERLEHPIVNLATEKIDLDVVSTVPQAICRKYCMVAYKKSDLFITLAVNDPLDLYGIEDVKSFFDRPCQIVLAKSNAIQGCIHKSYSELHAQKAFHAVSTTQESAAVDAAMEQEELDMSTISAETPIVSLVNSLIFKGYAEGASDIHFEPFEKFIKIRLRIDGQLLDYMQMESSWAASISTRIKIMSGLDIAERRVPQDGNSKIPLNGRNVDIRVSIIPTSFGEKIVLRFLSREVSLDNAGHYGMNEENYQKISRILRNPHGLIYITGPTGSGKTTTLYMMIEELAKQTINVSTIEDPVERNLTNINQVQVNARAGLTFESGLRSMLRQDPDVILIGETRDSETAQISVSAAITGHLVLSTLHTNDAVSSIVRLENMGVASYLVANSLVGVVAQRLVKKVCPFCKEVYTPSETDRRILPNATELVRGTGCVACNHSGYKGRIAVHEILEVDAEIRDLISQDASMQEIYRHIQDHNKMRSIKDDISELVAQGVTSMDEYLRHCSHFH